MKKIKKVLRFIFHKLGFDIIPLDIGIKKFTALNNNFDNLILNYENLFGDKFGDIPKNTKRLEIMKDLLGSPPSKAYFIVNSLYKSKNVKGDVCEFGVAQGITSQLIANEIIDNKNKTLHLFDSFEGLPKPTDKDILKDDIFNLGSIESYTGTMSNPKKLVLNRITEIQFPKNRLTIHKGFIEKLIVDKKSFPKLVSFAYLDFDFYKPIKIILEFLDSITNIGAIILVDDYDFFSTGAKTAVDEFIDQHNNYDLFIPEKSFGCFAILTKIKE